MEMTYSICHLYQLFAFIDCEWDQAPKGRQQNQAVIPSISETTSKAVVSHSYKSSKGQLSTQGGNLGLLSFYLLFYMYIWSISCFEECDEVALQSLHLFIKQRDRHPTMYLLGQIVGESSLQVTHLWSLKVSRLKKKKKQSNIKTS